MTRKTAYSMFAVLLVLAACAGAILWLVTTETGARRVGAFLAGRMGAAAQVRKVEGSILGGLALEGLTFESKPLRVRIARVQIRWRPLSFFSGWATVQALSLRGVAINDDRPEEKTTPDLTWPLVSGALASVSGAVELVEADDIVYTRLAGPPLSIRHFSGHAEWRRGRLTVRKISLAAPMAAIGGELTADFRKPALSLDLTAALSSVVGGMKTVSCRAHLLPGKSPEQAAGDVTLAGVSPSGRRTELAGVIGLTRTSLNLRKLELRQSGRKGAVTGEGELTFPRGGLFLRLEARPARLDLAEELTMATDLSGTVSVTGNLQAFQGRFSLANAGKGWRLARLSGSFAGTAWGVSFPALEGSWLGGSVRGGLQAAWGENISLRGSLAGRGLQPSLLSPEWRGVVNVALDGQLHWSGQNGLEGSVLGRLLDSRLHGQSLTGEAAARVSGGEISFASLVLHGRGFSLHASGGTKERITYQADIDDLAGLVPGAGGSLHARGWLTQRRGMYAFMAQGSGSSLAAQGARIGTLSFDVALGAGKDRPLRGTLKAETLTYGKMKLISAVLTAEGALSRHRAVAVLRASRAEMRADLSGSYQPGGWRGEITALAGSDAVGPWRLQSPAGLTLSAAEISLAPLVLQGAGAELLELKADLVRQPRQGSVRAVWRGINLGRANAWLTDLALTGTSTGSIEAAWRQGELSRLAGGLDAAGTITSGARTLVVDRAAVKLAGDERGLLATGEIDLAGGGRFEGRLASPSPVRLAVPEKGEIEARWREIDLTLFRPWFPRGVSLKGRLAGQIRGKLLPGGRPDLTGQASVTGGVIDWQREQGLLSTVLRQTELSLVWRGETASGTVELTLEDYGQIQAVYALPIPALLPPAINRNGGLSVALTGRLREKGLFTAAFPGLVQESRGTLNLALDLGGTWEAPVLGGSAEIADAGAYLPAAGITVRAASLKAHLAGDQVFLDSFRAESGAGNIELAAVVTLAGGKPAAYRGTLKGTQFQTIYLPELRLWANPDLTFTGTPEKLTIRGTVTIPQLTALGSRAPAAAAPNRDIVIVDAPPRREEVLPFALDLRVQVVLGEGVTVKDSGADVKLAGSIDMTADNLHDIRADGVIRIVKGTYSAQGINLDISHGRLIFAGRAGSPNLDILAVRKVADVTVGVLITGQPASPIIKLYSRPPLSDPDIMSYLVLGHPLQGGAEGLPLLVNAAGLLLSRGESASFQNQLKRRLGLEGVVIGTETVNSAPAGPGGTAAPGSVSQSLVTIGKYVTPSLYLSYGRSLFTDANLMRLRYKFSDHWEMETQSGSTSGADIYYKIEFR